MASQHDRASTSVLSTAEWNLILTALSAYQHNATFRPLYEKIVRLAVASGVPRQSEDIPCIKESGAGMRVPHHQAVWPR